MSPAVHQLAVDTIGGRESGVRAGRVPPPNRVLAPFLTSRRTPPNREDVGASSTRERSLFAAGRRAGNGSEGIGETREGWCANVALMQFWSTTERPQSAGANTVTGTSFPELTRDAPTARRRLRSGM